MSKEWLKQQGNKLWESLAAIYVVLMISALYFICPVTDSQRPLKLFDPRVLAYIFFTLAPPIWFVIESIYIFGPGHGKDEDFKHSQELVSRVWVTCSLLLGFYWFGKT